MDDTSNMGEKLSGGPTQDEVMAISLHRLRLRSGDVMADVGCGTGKVSIEAAKVCSKVYALDMRPEAVRITRQNIVAADVGNVEALDGSAIELLPELGPLDAAFVGGSKDLEKVLEILASNVSGRIVVNAVLLRTLHTAVQTMRRLGILEEALQVQMSRSHELAGDIMFRPIDPVFIIVGKVD